MDPTDNRVPLDPADDRPVDDPASYRTERFLNTNEVPRVDDVFASAARSAGVAVVEGPAGGGDAEGGGGRSGDDGGSSGGSGGSSGGEGRFTRFRHKRPKTFWAIVVVLVLMIPVVITYAQALTKPGSESFEARTAEWARDMKLGFAVDWFEQKYYATDKFPDGGAPDPGLLASKPPVEPSTSAAAPTQPGAPTTAAVPRTPPPGPVASPVNPALAGEGEWSPTGPLVNGVPAVYTTKVRPNAQKTSLLVFLAWIDPKLTDIQLFPGTDLPGGTWDAPNHLPAERCPQTIMASNGGFRMDQARGGYYAEGREAFKLRDGAASLIFLKDGTVDVAEWGRDYTAADLPRINTVRQNLELMVDDGQPRNVDGDKDWGALLKNVYFVWRSGYGVTADGALVYAGGPALTPADLARTLMNAGAVRVMEGDINPEWVTANLYSVGPDGTCVGTKGLDGPEDKGGMRQPADRYLDTDTRDFVGVFAKQQ